MRRPTLDARDRRALVVGMALLAPMLLFVFVVRPFARTFAGSRERVTSERGLLTRELAVLHAADANRDVVRRGRIQLDTAGAHLLEGDDALAASAALAGYVRSIAEDSGLHLEGTETAGGDLSDVRLEIRADGDLAAIVGFLRAAEDGDVLVSVERIGIDRHGADDGAQTGRLTLSATIRGYARAWYASTDLRDDR